MPLQLYKNTMKQLSHALSQKLKTPVSYSNKTIKEKENLKWITSNDNVIFPLSINLTPAGHLKVNSEINQTQLSEVFNIIQWTVTSLEDIFQTYNITLFGDNKNFPILLNDSENNQALEMAYDIYEQSSAGSFLHWQKSTLNRSLFCADLNNTLIFISNLSALEYEEQLFLSTYFKSQAQGPLVVCSLKNNLNGNKKPSKKILPSLLKCFISTNLNSLMKSDLNNKVTPLFKNN